MQSMFHKEQKINGIIDGQIKEVSQSTDADGLLSEVEETLYQIIEQEFRVMDMFDKIIKMRGLE